MAKDPAFLFYPGDYLKDTQCLSEKSQVAYDRIMCEHMRNISTDMSNIAVSKVRVNFFIKRLSDDEKDEIMHVLKEVDGGYQIEWVAISMSKRKRYTNSRAENRSNKNKTDMSNISEHMENVIVNKDEIVNVLDKNSIQGEYWDNIKLKWKSDWRWIDKTCMDNGNLDRLLMLKRMDDFLGELESKEDFKDVPGLKKHFFHWHKKYHNGGQKNIGNSTTGAAKLGTSDARVEALRKW